MSTRLRICSLLAVAALAGAAPVGLTAQTANPAGVFVATLNDFPDIDARALVVRESGRGIVVLREGDITPEALAMGLFALERVSERELPPGQGALVPITGFTVATPSTGEQRRRLEEVLHRLERVAERQLGTLGRGRWVRYR